MTTLISCLKEIPDKRRNQSKQYQLWEIVFCAIACSLAGDVSYRNIANFTKCKFAELKELLGLKWEKVPHFTTFRNILTGIDEKDFENIVYIVISCCTSLLILAFLLDFFLLSNSPIR